MERPARTSTGRIDAFLGHRLAQRREELGLTQAVVAGTVRVWDEGERFSKWRPATLAAIEGGRRNISLDELGALCTILGVSLAELAGDTTSQGGPLPHMLGQYSERRPYVFPQSSIDGLLRAQRLERLESAALARATGIDSWPARETVADATAQPSIAAVNALFRRQVSERFDGRDLLAERDQRVADGQGNRTWVSRRLADEVANLPAIVWLRDWLHTRAEWVSTGTGSRPVFTPATFAKAAARAEKRGWR